jgi:pentatricopeptide repeat protein
VSARAPRSCPRAAPRADRPRARDSYHEVIEGYGKKVGRVDEALAFFETMRRGQEDVKPTAKTYTLLVDCLGKAARVDESLAMIDTMREDDVMLEPATWNALTSGLLIAGRIDEVRAKVDDGEIPPTRGIYANLFEGYRREMRVRRRCCLAAAPRARLASPALRARPPH